jgi:hypothetical protein
MTDSEEFPEKGRCGDAAIKQALHLAWAQLASYNCVMSQAVYNICLFLDPQIKGTSVEKHWEEDWIYQGEERLLDACSRYKNVHVEAPQYLPRCRPPVTRRAGRRAAPNPFRSEIHAQGDMPALDELEAYCKMAVLNPQV